jgi:hypothetical protein
VAEFVNLTCTSSEFSLLFPQVAGNGESAAWVLEMAPNNRWLYADSFEMYSFGSQNIKITGCCNGSQKM